MVPAAPWATMEVPTQPSPRGANKNMTPEEVQQFEEMKARISVLEAESAALQIALMSLIANHPDQTKLHLYLTRLYELNAAPKAQALLKRLDKQQLEATRFLVESWGAIPPNM